MHWVFVRFKWTFLILSILGKILNKEGQCANEMMCDIGHAMPYFGQSKDEIAAGHIKNRVKIDKLIE